MTGINMGYKTISVVKKKNFRGGRKGIFSKKVDGMFFYPSPKRNIIEFLV